MKPTAAIVEPAQIDLAMIEQQITVEIGGVRDDLRAADRYDKQAESARDSARRRRLRIGELLTKARPAWPARGPAPKGSKLPPGAPASWAEFLVRLKIDDATARRYMDEHRDPDGFAQKQAKLDQPEDERPDEREDREDKPANVNGGSGEQSRGAWCTPKVWADAVGPWDLDPFSNPRSHIVASARCMLEDGGNGLASDEPGHYRSGTHGTGVANAKTRVWIQPPYERGFVERVIAHYGHTRFCALLRWSPDTGWFEQLWPLVKLVVFPIGERLDFDPPPGVPESSTPHAHAFHYSDPRDVTEEIARRCIVLARHEALRLVR